MVTLDGDVLRRYPRVSRYNSPYPAHDAGCAVDLYPDRVADQREATEWASSAERSSADHSSGRSPREDGETASNAADRREAAERAPSPVAGDVVETRTVRCPEKPYAEDTDHLVVVDTGAYLARMLHVDPAVEPGDTLAVGDDVGRLVRSGFFAPWVDNHIHLGFRERDQNAVRASGSLPLDLGLSVESAPWDGRGRVVETGRPGRDSTPRAPCAGRDVRGAGGRRRGVLDGGLPHYEAGGRRVRPTPSRCSAPSSGTASTTGPWRGGTSRRPRTATPSGAVAVARRRDSRPETRLPRPRSLGRRPRRRGVPRPVISAGGLRGRVRLGFRVDVYVVPLGVERAEAVVETALVDVGDLADAEVGADLRVRPVGAVGPLESRRSRRGSTSIFTQPS